jgi:hypothetical protein
MPKPIIHVDGRKCCSVCSTWKPLDNFTKRASMSDGLCSHCRTCAAVRSKRWRLANAARNYANNQRWKSANRERVNAAARASYVRRVVTRPKYTRGDRLQAYGLTEAQYDQMLVEQGGACAICRRAGHTHHRLGVDHDHATGRVRGLLCSNCNASLGLLQDRIDLLYAAIRYLSA